MLCYRCGTHNPDGTEACSHCAQPLGAGAKPTPVGALRRRSAPPDDIPFRVGQVLCERYDLKEFVGTGPVGWVYRAEDRDVGGEVALKLIRSTLLQTEEERAHFLKSIRTGRQFSHPQLARVYEEGEHDGHVFFTEPHLGGRSLRSVLALKAQSGQIFPAREGLPLLVQIASALTAAHAVGAHGDVKPENIFLLPDALKLTDFGLAQGISREPFVQAQKAFHSDPYLSPEYIAGTEVDARADVYALGVLMGEILAGVVPDGNIPSLRHANPELPLAVNGLYRRALNESRDARPESPADLIAELTQLISAGEKPAFAFPPAPPAEALTEDFREPLPPPVPLDTEESLPGEEGRQVTELVSEEEVVRAQRPASGAWPTTELANLDRPLSPPYRSRENRRRVRRSHSLSVLLWIALAGLGLGAAGGWLLLERLRLRSLPPPPREETTSPAGALTGEPVRRALTRSPPPPRSEAGEEADEVGAPAGSDGVLDVVAEPVPGTVPAVEPPPSTGTPPPDEADDEDARMAQRPLANGAEEVAAAFQKSPVEGAPDDPVAAAMRAAAEDRPGVDNVDELVSYLEGTKAEADARVSGAPSQ